MKLDADEKELLDSVERGEWKSAKGGKRKRARYSRYAKATFRKDRRLNIRLSSKDVDSAYSTACVSDMARPSDNDASNASSPSDWLHMEHEANVPRGLGNTPGR